MSGHCISPHHIALPFARRLREFPYIPSSKGICHDYRKVLADENPRSAQSPLVSDAAAKEVRETGMPPNKEREKPGVAPSDANSVPVSNPDEAQKMRRATRRKATADLAHYGKKDRSSLSVRACR